MAKTKNKNLNLEHSDTINYKGEVKIVYTKNNKNRTLKKKNKGQIGLYTFLTRSLAGYPVDKYRPCRVMLYTKDKINEKKYREILTQPVNYSTTPVLLNNGEQTDSSKNNCVQYTFIIPSSIIKSEFKSSQTYINKIILFNSFPVKDDKDDISKCAEIEFSSDLEVSSVNMIIYWNLSFSSQGEE